MELTFPNIPENERISRTLAAAFASMADPTVEELADFKTAVSEAITNAIIHAYPAGTEGTIYLRLSRQGHQVHVTVTDTGVGIADIAKSMEPLYTTASKEERSGMGFTFMEAFTDTLSVDSTPGKGTVVRMSKKMGGE